MRQVALAVFAYLVLQLFVPTLWERFMSSAPEWVIRTVVFAGGLICLAFIVLAEPVWRRVTRYAEFPVSSTILIALIAAAVAASAWWLLIVVQPLRARSTPIVSRDIPLPLGPQSGPGPNVGAVVLATVPKQPAVGEPLGVDVTIRNTGDAPALRVKGWSVAEPVAAFDLPDFNYSGDPVLNLAVMQPSSEHFTKHWLSRRKSTGDVAPLNQQMLDAIMKGEVRITAHGRLTYEDRHGGNHWVEWCYYLQKDFSGWVECASHNGAGTDGTIASPPSIAQGLSVQGIKFSTPTVGERLLVDVLLQNQAPTNIVAHGRATVFVVGLDENEQLPIRAETDEAFEQHGWNELDKYGGPIRETQVEPDALVIDRQGTNPNGPGLTDVEVSELRNGRARAYVVGRQRWTVDGKEHGCDYCAWLGPDGGAQLCRRGNRVF